MFRVSTEVSEARLLLLNHDLTPQQPELDAYQNHTPTLPESYNMTFSFYFEGHLAVV